LKRINTWRARISNRRFASSELERSITNPDAEILPQNRTFRAVTREGATITGTLLNNEDKYAVQVLDSTGRLVSLSRTNLKQSSVLEKSPMPSYKDKLSKSELADLTSYLVSLKGVELQ
jgi:hypothetical protein